jgi:hypothetical protein
MKKLRTREGRLVESIEADAEAAYSKLGGPIERVVRHRCTCGEEYLSREEAESCLATEIPPKFAPGDVVTCGDRFGWFDGDEAWIATRKPDPRTASGDRLTFFYVVTLVDRGDSVSWGGGKHRNRYHLATRAMSGESGYAAGYTFDVNHWTPEKVENPPELPGLAELIGIPAKSLL